MTTKEARLAALEDPGSETFRSMYAAFAGMMKKKVQVRSEVSSESSAGESDNRETVRLDSSLPYGHLEYLRREFGYNYDSRPQGEPYAAPFAEAYAKSATRSLLEQKGWKGEELLHVNGDVRQLVVRKGGAGKVVRSFADVSRLRRFAMEDKFVERSCKSKIEHMQRQARDLLSQMREGEGETYSSAGTATRLEADTVVFDGLRWQGNAKTVVQYLATTGASRAKGWFFYTPALLSQETGEFCGGRFSFFVDKVLGLVVFHEKKRGARGDNAPIAVHRISDYFSLFSRRPTIVGGAAGIVELQGKGEGRMQWVMTAVSPDDASEITVEDKVPLWNLDDASDYLLIRMFVHEGTGCYANEPMVLRDKESVFSKSVASLVASKEGVTVERARKVRAMYRDQVMLPNGGVVLPPTANGLVEEYLARAVYRRAFFAKMSMVAADKAADISGTINSEISASFARGLCVLMWGSGLALQAALQRPFDEILLAGADRTWDIDVVQESDRMWLKDCWMKVADSSRGAERDGPLVTTPSDDVDKLVLGFFSDSSVQPEQAAMGQEREEASRKIAEAVGASGDNFAYRLVEPKLDIHRPILQEATYETFDVETMKEEFDEEFPGLSEVDMSVRTHLWAESERSVDALAPLIKVQNTLEPVGVMRQLDTGFNVGVSGPRAHSKVEVLHAFGSRVAGAPSYQWPVHLEEQLEQRFENFARVCFKDGWREYVAKKIDDGYMFPTEEDIRRTVAKMSPSNVKRVENEQFSFPDLQMDKLRAMFKRAPKDRQDLGVAFEHKPNQTIIYQDSKITNAFFSTALGKFHDLLDDVLRPGFMINPRVDKSVVEYKWNSVRHTCVPGVGERVQDVDADISQCDKSQGAENLAMYTLFLNKFGFGAFNEFWSLSSGQKDASDVKSSVMVRFYNQVVSGLFKTISENSVIVGVAVITSLGCKRDEIRRMAVSGDDFVATLVLDREIGASTVESRLATNFNFDVKLTMDASVVYWCGRLGVEVEGYTYFVKDPGRVRSSFFKPQSTAYDAEEAWESFLDDTAAYDYEELVTGVAIAYQKRMGSVYPPIGTTRAISALRRNKKAFVGRFKGVKVIE
uniref:Replicase large subunit n=1 Tax=Erysiphe necator associated tobamo-like virus 2 TaxID=2744813 RepID=A0A8E4MGB2_9VIRU|nr:RNA-dependent RNA polymerase [Erysiphe necator associated tobamo-like virus 2]